MPDTEIYHRADCALNTTHHLTCTCDYWTRWRGSEVPRHDPQCSWIRMHPNGLSYMGNCDCEESKRPAPTDRSWLEVDGA